MWSLLRDFRELQHEWFVDFTVSLTKKYWENLIYLLCPLGLNSGSPWKCLYKCCLNIKSIDIILSDALPKDRPQTISLFSMFFCVMDFPQIRSNCQRCCCAFSIKIAHCWDQHCIRHGSLFSSSCYNALWQLLIVFAQATFDWFIVVFNGCNTVHHFKF